MADTGIPTSFIPHDTAAAPSSAPRRSGGGLNDLLLLCAIVLFIASAALAVGVFLYGQFLATEKSSKLAQLERAKAAFEPSLIQQLTRLDDRMHAADKLLSAHIAPTAFFSTLEQATLQTVSFETLELQASDASHIGIEMEGVARSVNSIALQADLFSKNGVIASPIFSDIARQQDGVHFNLSALVNPAAIRYAALAGGAAAVQDLPVQQGSAPPQSEPSPFGQQPQDSATSSAPAVAPTQ